MNDRGLSGAGIGKDKKRRRVDNDLEEPKRQRMEPKFYFYIGLTETPKKIHLDTGKSLTKNLQEDNLLIERKYLKSFASFMS